VLGNASGGYGSIALDATTGAWTYTLDNASPGVQALAAGESHDETFAVRVTDDQGASADQLITVTVTGTNDAPVVSNAASAAAGAVQEDTSLTTGGQLAASDVDHGATQTWSVVGDANGAYGSIALNAATGAWTYSLDNGSASVQSLAAGESHNETFTVQVADDHGATAAQAVTVTVTGVNDAPVAVNDAATTNEDTPLTLTTASLLANDTDVDAGDSKTLVSVAGAQHGTVALSGSDVIYTPNANYNGADNFTYTMQDAAGAQSTATVNVTVNPVNDPPNAVNDSNALTVTSLASQVHSNLVNWVHWTSVNVSGHDSYGGNVGTVGGYIDLGGGQTVDVTYNGQFAFTQINGLGTNYYTTPATQPGDYTSGTGTYTSAGVADGPTSSDIIGLNFVGQDRTLTFSQPVNNLYFAIVSMNGNGYIFDQDFQVASYGRGYWGDGALTRVDLGNGQFEVVGGPYSNSEPHGVLAINGTVQTLTWTGAANEYWNGFTVGTYGLAQTATASGNLLANDSDPESDPISVTAVNGQNIVGDSVTLDLASGAQVQVHRDGTYLYDEHGAFAALGQGQTTVDNFHYTVTDSHGASSTADVAITVTGVNDAPTAVNDSATTNEDTPLSIAVLANDTDPDAGDTHSLVSATGAQHGTLALSGDHVVYTPNANYNGADNFTYTMQDAAGAQSTATVNVTVNPVTDSYTLSNHVANGSFEQFGGGGTSTGSTAITGWTVIGSDVDRVASSGWQSGDGSYSLDLNGFHPGGVQQVLQTTPGEQYTVGFDLSKNPGNTDHATVQVSVDNTSLTSQSYTFSDANSATNMMWSQQSFTFVATGTTTTLSFASTYPNDSVPSQPWQYYAEGPALDEVVVVSNKAIGNFTTGAGGDVLQLHDLLSSISAPHDATAFSGGYLNFQQSGSDTLVQIDANGGGDHYLTLATLTHALLTPSDTSNYVL